MQTAEAVEQILLKVKREGGIVSGFRAKSVKWQFWVQPAQVGFRDANSRFRVKLVNEKNYKIVKSGSNRRRCVFEMQTAEAVEEILLKVKREGGVFFSGFCVQSVKW